jgi:hypothetical protein
MHFPETSVQELIEVDPAIFTSNTHFQDSLFHLTVKRERIFYSFEPERCIQFFEELKKSFLLDFYTGKSLRLNNPYAVEQVKIFRERRDRVVFVHIVSLKLLNNDQNEQVKHDVSDDQDKYDIVDSRESPATSLSVFTLRLSVHAVVH